MKLHRRNESYLGFNLVIGTFSKDKGSKLFHYCNRGKKITLLENGVHGISNASLNTDWPKVIKGKKAISRMLKKGKFSHDRCFEIMLDKKRAKDSLLPSTGVSLKRERELSSLFISTPTYGTKSTSIFSFNQDGKVSLSELTHLDCSAKQMQKYAFKLQEA